MPTFVEKAEQKKTEKKGKMPEIFDDDKYGKTTQEIQAKC
jgi:hypothetical protein